MEEYQDTQVSAEQEGVVGSPTDTVENQTDKGENEQQLAEAARTETSDSELNRRIAAARRGESKRVKEQLDSEFAALGFTNNDGNPITNAKEALSYFRAAKEAQIQAKATAQKRSVEEVREEEDALAKGKAAQRQEQQQRAQAEFMQEDLAEFQKTNPGVDVAKLLAKGGAFLRFCGNRLGRESMVDLYDDYTAIVGEAAAKGAAKKESKAERGTGSGQSGGDGLTNRDRAELDAWNKRYPEMKMTPKEYLEIYKK